MLRSLFTQPADILTKLCQLIQSQPSSSTVTYLLINTDRMACKTRLSRDSVAIVQQRKVRYIIFLCKITYYLATVPPRDHFLSPVPDW